MVPELLKHGAIQLRLRFVLEVEATFPGLVADVTMGTEAIVHGGAEGAAAERTAAERSARPLSSCRRREKGSIV